MYNIFSKVLKYDIVNVQESSHYYDSEKYYNQSPGIAAGSPDMGGWEPGMGDDSLHSIPV